MAGVDSNRGQMNCDEPHFDESVFRWCFFCRGEMNEGKGSGGGGFLVLLVCTL